MAEYVWVILISLLFYFYTVTCIFFTVRVAALKGRRKSWGWLALFLGLIGFCIVSFLPNKKGVKGETNPVKAAFRSVSGSSPKVIWLVALGLVVVVGGVLLGNHLTVYLENRSFEDQLSEETGKEEDVIAPSAVYGAVKDVFTGDGNNFAVTEKGDLYGWGRISIKPLDEEGRLYEKVKKVAVSGDTVLLLTTDGTLYGKGDNTNGLIAGSDEKTVKSFQKLEEDVVDFDLSATAAALVTERKNLYIWGTNTYGQLARDRSKQNEITDKIASSVKKVEVTERSVYYMNEKGEVFGVGSNAYGQFGKAEKTYRSAVKLAGGCTDFAAGEDFLLLLKKDGTVWSAGNDSFGQLGRETLEEYEELKEEASKAGTEKEDEEKVENKKAAAFGPIEFEEKVSAVYAAGNCAFALIGNEAYAWGKNDLGQLGTGDRTHYSEPTLIDEEISALATDGACTLILTEDGMLLGAGDRRNFRLGSLGEGDGLEEIAEIKEEE